MAANAIDVVLARGQARIIWILTHACARLTARVRPIVLGGLFAFCSFLSQRAYGDATQAKAGDVETLAAARSLAIEGVKLARAGYCEQAIERLERAEALHHSSIVLAELGECYLLTGKVVAASEALRSVAHEPLPQTPSAAQLSAKGRAEVLLMKAVPQIAQLTLDVSGPPSGSALDVTVDGQGIAQALLGVQRPTDPGRHRVKASAPGFVSDGAEIELSAGEAQVLKLTLRALPASTSVPARDRSAAADVAKPTATSRKLATDVHPARSRAAYSLLAIGAAGVAAGVGFGAAAWSLKTRLDDLCTGRSCPASARDELDAAKRWGLASTIAFAVGAGSGAVGALLLLLDRRDARARRWSVRAGPGNGLAAETRF